MDFGGPHPGPVRDLRGFAEVEARLQVFEAGSAVGSRRDDLAVEHEILSDTMGQKLQLVGDLGEGGLEAVAASGIDAQRYSRPSPTDRPDAIDLELEAPSLARRQ